MSNFADGDAIDKKILSTPHTYEVELSTADAWRIHKAVPDTHTYCLVHPRFEPITHIPSFDEACRLRDAIKKGTFISFVRSYERFIEELRRRLT